MFLHQQLKYDRVLGVYTQRSHIQIPSVQHLEQICSDYSGWKLLWSFVCCCFIWNKSLLQCPHFWTQTRMSKQEDGRWTLAAHLIWKRVRRCWQTQGGFLISFREIQEEMKLLLRWGVSFLKLFLCKLRLIPLWTKSIPCHGLFDRGINSKCHITGLQLHC